MEDITILGTSAQR